MNWEEVKKGSKNIFSLIDRESFTNPFHLRNEFKETASL